MTMIKLNVHFEPLENPGTIWNKLAARLGRQPTDAEASDEMKRLMSENTADMASKGKLKFQKKR